jgi:hypothetical protein
MAIFDKNGGCVAIDHRPEARTLHPTYVFLTLITFLDFWWRPFRGQESVGVSLRYCWGPSASEGPQKHDLTMFLEYNV